MGAVDCSVFVLMRIATPSPWGCVSDIRTLTSLQSTNLRNTIDVEVGEGSVSESHRRRGQGCEEHRLSLHLVW